MAYFLSINGFFQMKKIQLTKGYVAVVDDADYERLNKVKWQAVETPNRGIVYARRTIRIDKKFIYTHMHREVLGLREGGHIQVDHIDCNGLNNTRNNLRLANPRQNNQNKRLQKNNTSGFKGVYWKLGKNRWTANIRVNGKTKLVGYFRNPVEAARAYDKVAMQLFGEFARTNLMLGLL